MSSANKTRKTGYCITSDVRVSMFESFRMAIVWCIVKRDWIDNLRSINDKLDRQPIASIWLRPGKESDRRNNEQ